VSGTKETTVKPTTWILAMLALGACARAPVVVTRDAVEPEAARADAAFGALRTRLTTRLTTALGESGPAGAIEVCGTEARALTEEVGRAQGLEVGRTSLRLRTPATAHVNAAENRPALFDLGERVGVLAPMPLVAMCTLCHGPRETLAPEVRAALANRYPQDQAVGFSAGELRGYFWAEVPKRR
jgi:hypothetical protein